MSDFGTICTVNEVFYRMIATNDDYAAFDQVFDAVVG